MNAWQALVEIVKSFNERGATKLGFATFCVAMAALLLVALAIAGRLEVAQAWLETPDEVQPRVTG
jgi:hypothetical protein